MWWRTCPSASSWAWCRCSGEQKGSAQCAHSKLSFSPCKASTGGLQCHTQWDIGTLENIGWHTNTDTQSKTNTDTQKQNIQIQTHKHKCKSSTGANGDSAWKSVSQGETVSWPLSVLSPFTACNRVLQNYCCIVITNAERFFFPLLFPSLFYRTPKSCSWRVNRKYLAMGQTTPP